MLLSVQAVGPKVALAVLSAATPRELLATLAAGDAARLQAVPGIGKRTAERIIVELREKVGVVADLDVSAGVGTAGGAIKARRVESPRTLARDGLLELGYSHSEAEALLDGAEGASAEELLSQALRTARAG